MPGDDDVMTSEAFAHASGLTRKALRFYANVGLLSSARADPQSGDWVFSPDQVPHAGTLRRAHDLQMPLEDKRTLMAMEPAAATRVVDEHEAAVAPGDVRAPQRAVGQVSTQLRFVPRSTPADRP